MPKLHAAEKAFIAALAKGTKRTVAAVTQEILDAGTVERGRLVSVNLAGTLGALKTLPSLSALTRLTHLDVSDNSLTHLDRGNLGQLGELRAPRNKLVSIDLRGCGGLESLDVGDNRLATVDLSPLVCANWVQLDGNPLRKVLASDVLAYALASVRALGKKLTLRRNIPAELHEFAEAYNWDDSDVFKDLGWVATNPACDRATALLIYWRAQPSYYYKLAKPTADDKRKLAFLHAIERRFADGFYTSSTLPYDPVADMGANLRDSKIPAPMRVKITGRALR